MNEELGMDNIEQRVLLLGIYKAPKEDTLKDVLITMEHSKVCDIKTGKKYLKNLKQLNFINDDELTFLGIQEAKKVELEFKL